MERIKLKGANNRALDKILNYLYTNDENVINISLNNVYSIMECAKELDIRNLIKICRQFLIKKQLQIDMKPM